LGYRWFPRLQPLYFSHDHYDVSDRSQPRLNHFFYVAASTFFCARPYHRRIAILSPLTFPLLDIHSSNSVFRYEILIIERTLASPILRFTLQVKTRAIDVTANFRFGMLSFFVSSDPPAQDEAPPFFFPSFRCPVASLATTFPPHSQETILQLFRVPTLSPFSRFGTVSRARSSFWFPKKCPFFLNNCRYANT